MEGDSARNVSVEGAPDELQVGRPLSSPAFVRRWWRVPCASSGGKECQDRGFTVNVSGPRGNLAGRTLQEKGNGLVVQGCGRGPHGSAGAAGDMHEGRPGHKRATGADDIAGGEQRRTRLQCDRAGPGGRDGPAQHVPVCAAWAQPQAEPATPRGIQASLQGDGCPFEDDPGPCFGRQLRQARNGCRERRRIVSTSRVNCGAVNGQRTRKGHGRIVENRWAAQGLLDPIREQGCMRWRIVTASDGQQPRSRPDVLFPRHLRLGPLILPYGLAVWRVRTVAFLSVRRPAAVRARRATNAKVRRYQPELGHGPGKGAAEAAGQRAPAGAEGTGGGRPSTAAGSHPAGNSRLRPGEPLPGRGRGRCGLRQGAFAQTSEPVYGGVRRLAPVISGPAKPPSTTATPPVRAGPAALGLTVHREVARAGWSRPKRRSGRVRRRAGEVRRSPSAGISGPLWPDFRSHR
ncbi:hypothetical protein SRIMM317S_00456 [Streptomyces rimosus subsp. rimosus]